MKLPQKITKVLKSVLPAALILVAGFFTYQYIGAANTTVEPFFNAESNSRQFKDGSLNLIGQDKIDCMLGKLSTGTAGSTCVAPAVSNDFNTLTTGDQDIAAAFSIFSSDSSNTWNTAADISESDLLDSPVQLNVAGTTDVDVIEVDGQALVRESLVVGLDANTANSFPTIPDVNADGVINVDDIDQDLIAAGSIGAEDLVYHVGDAVVPNSVGQRRLCANQVGLLYPCNPLAPDVPVTYSWQIGPWNSCLSYSCTGSGSQQNINYKKPNGYASNIPGTLTSLATWQSLVQSGNVTYTTNNLWQLQGPGAGNLSVVAGQVISQLPGQSVFLGGPRPVWRLSSECFGSTPSTSCQWEKATVHTGAPGAYSYSQTQYPSAITTQTITETVTAITETTSNVSCSAQANKNSCENVTGCSWQGTQDRSVQCQDVNGNIATNASSCSATAPDSSRACSISWYTGLWGTCNAGTQYRSVYCRDNLNGGSLPDYICTGAEPANTQSCSSQAFLDWNGNVFDQTLFYNGLNNPGLSSNYDSANPVSSITNSNPSIYGNYYYFESAAGIIKTYGSVESSIEKVNGIPGDLYKVDFDSCSTGATHTPQSLQSCQWVKYVVNSYQNDDFGNFVDQYDATETNTGQSVYST